MEKTKESSRGIRGFEFENQLTELESFIKAANIIFSDLVNGHHDRMDCEAAMHGVLDSTTEAFEKLRRDMLGESEEA